MPLWASRILVVVAMSLGAACALHAQVSNTPAPVAQVSAASSTSPQLSSLRRDQRQVTLAVAARAIARGETLQADDITLVDTTIVWRWSSIAPDTTRPAAGWVTRRNIAAGEVLRAPAVMAPPVVTSGAAVTAIWQDGPLRLVLAGVATNTAAVGAPVSVRIGSNRRLDGIAIAPNTVRLR
ncbi:MAG TPA: flagellar basal body P-ring formation chaperone FlgA [Gemmatimonas sp.]|uniref:flagellar basal body P-ring formation chaperone FlgA n=1 Tax=Gemmatimonas sp. TaxID=1962908 RepID=UPI002ED89622